MFARPEVIAIVRKQYVPLALSALLVNGVERVADPESRELYTRLKATGPAPQGVAVLDHKGRVLDWVLTFENDAEVLAFLRGAATRHAEVVGKDRVPTRRFHRYPDQVLQEMTVGQRALAPKAPEEDSAARGPMARPSAPWKLRAKKGELHARLFGRAKQDGELIADCTRQEHYVQDHFVVSRALQQALVAALSADAETVRVDGLARLLAEYAYLGHMDIRPLKNPRRGTGTMKTATMTATVAGPGVYTLAGKTDVSGSQAGQHGHAHTVTLDWQGVLALREGRIVRLLLVGDGRERIRYGRKGQRGVPEVASLPGGRAIDLEQGVRYGVDATPVARDVQPAAGAQRPAGGMPGTLGEKMREMQRLARARMERGDDPRPLVRPAMERFKDKMMANDLAGAERELDGLIAKLGGTAAPKKASAGGGQPSASAEAAMDRLRRAMQRFGALQQKVGRGAREVQRLLAAGEHAEAAKKADELASWLERLARLADAHDALDEALGGR